MPIEIIMPALSQTTDEVHLIDWYVKPGDKIKKGDFLCEVETDKVTTDVESFADGIVLKILVEPDTTVKAGTVIAILGNADENIEKVEEIEKNKAKSKESIVSESKNKSIEQKAEIINKELEVTKEKETESEWSNIKTTSIVKNLAKKKGIDLGKIKGTGPSGLITIKDLDNYETLIKQGEFVVKEPSTTMGQKVKLSNRQLEVAKNLTESSRTIPTYTVTIKVWINHLLNIRNKNTNIDSEKISFDSFFIYALAQSLKRYPRLNGYYDNETLIIKECIQSTTLQQ